MVAAAYGQLFAVLDWMLTAPEEELLDYETLLVKIRAVGLYNDCRCSPHDSNMSIYGDDAAYILQHHGRHLGIWQTPAQLAAFLLRLRELGPVRTYLDVGTSSGWTVSLVAAYLCRFGLERLDTYDVIDFCAREVRDFWAARRMPVTYHCFEGGAVREGSLLEKYDCVFIDGDHDTGVFTDFETYKDRAGIVVFHDINDAFCPAVRRCWQEVRQRFPDRPAFEFTEHPNGFDLMGIGVLVLKSP